MITNIVWCMGGSVIVSSVGQCMGVLCSIEYYV